MKNQNQTRVRMKTKVAWIAGLTTMCGWLVVPAGNAVPVTNFFEYFDTNTVGLLPSGWGQEAAGIGYVTNDISQSSPNSLFYTGSDGIGIFKSLSPSISSNFNDGVEFRFSINATQANQLRRVWVVNSGGNLPMTIVGFDASGQITATTNSAGDSAVIGSYLAGVWYDVDVELHPSAKRFSIFVSSNGVSVASLGNLTFQRDNANFDMVYINGYGNSTTHFDNMSVISGVPEPATSSLIGMGLLGFGLARRAMSRHNP